MPRLIVRRFHAADWSTRCRVLGQRAPESALRVDFFVHVRCTKSEKRRKVYFQRDVFPKNRAMLFLRYASCTRVRLVRAARTQHRHSDFSSYAASLMRNVIKIIEIGHCVSASARDLTRYSRSAIRKWPVFARAHQNNVNISQSFDFC